MFKQLLSSELRTRLANSFDCTGIPVQWEEKKGRYAAKIYGKTFQEGDAAFLNYYSKEMITTDWDLGPNHAADCVVFHNFSQLIEAVRNDVKLFPDAVWEIQKTKNGYHGVLIGGAAHSDWRADNGWETRLELLGCDPLYLQGDPNIWSWRVTPKNTRDWVIRPMFRVYGTKGVIDPKRLILLELYYDIVEFLKNKCGACGVYREW